MSTIEMLEPEVLHQWLSEAKTVVVIDVLVDEHFKAVHLPAARNFCVYEIVFLENIAKSIPDKDQEIVVYGSGEKSLEAKTAAEKLINAGYRKVHVLRGGLKGWKALGYDVEGDPIQPQLVAHLKSEEFFFVRMFPRASFTITSAKQIDEVPSSLHNFNVRGVFELRGMKNDLAFLATASFPQNGEAKIEAHFDIDRTQWGVLYGSSKFFEHLGYHLVYNPISIQICLLVRIKI